MRVRTIEVLCKKTCSDNFFKINFPVNFVNFFQNRYSLEHLRIVPIVAIIITTTSNKKFLLFEHFPSVPSAACKPFKFFQSLL